MSCTNCPHLGTTGCIFTYIGGRPYCTRELKGESFSTNQTEEVGSVLENQGFYSFNEEEEKAYNESINKLYKPTGININELRPEDCCGKEVTE